MTWVPDREQLAWAAGLFDGEGNARGGLRRRHRFVVASIAQAHAELPDRFCAVVGAGTVKGPYKPRYENGLPYWVWSTNRLEYVQHVAAVLWPWLGGVKRKQFALAVTSYRKSVPEYLRCEHGSIYSKCSPCRVAAVNRAWAKRSPGMPLDQRNAAICQAFADGESRKSIAERFRLGYPRICVIIKEGLNGE